MDKENENVYGSKIRKLRLDRGLTQNEVAESLHVSPGYICNVENGRTALSLRLLKYFAVLTGRSLDSLVGYLDDDYEKTAIEHELTEEIAKMDSVSRKKLLRILKIWNSEEDR